MDIKNTLTIIGLSANFLGSVLLALHILGDKRIEKIDNWLRQEFSIVRTLTTIKDDLLRYCIIGGLPFFRIQREGEHEKPITMKQVLLYHFLPILLITLVSIWIIAFYGFRLSPTKGFVVALFLSILAFSQNLYMRFMALLWLSPTPRALMIVLNDLASRSCLMYKTWGKLPRVSDGDQMGGYRRNIRG